MNRFSAVGALLEAIAALPESDRQSLALEMQRRGYLDGLAALVPPGMTAPSALGEDTAAAAETERLQFGEGPDGLLCATVAGWEGCKSFGRDRLEAIQNLICLIGAQAVGGDLIALQPAGGELDTFDSEAAIKSRDYQQVLSYLESYQRRLSAAPEEE